MNNLYGSYIVVQVTIYITQQNGLHNNRHVWGTRRIRYDKQWHVLECQISRQTTLPHGASHIGKDVSGTLATCPGIRFIIKVAGLEFVDRMIATSNTEEFGRSSPLGVAPVGVTDRTPESKVSELGAEPIDQRSMPYYILKETVFSL